MATPELDPPAAPRPDPRGSSLPPEASPTTPAKPTKRRHRKDAAVDAPTSDADPHKSDGWTLQPLGEDESEGVSEKLLAGVLVLALCFGFGMVVFKKLKAGQLDPGPIASVFEQDAPAEPPPNANDRTAEFDPFAPEPAASPTVAPTMAAAEPVVPSQPEPVSAESFDFGPRPEPTQYVAAEPIEPTTASINASATADADAFAMADFSEPAVQSTSSDRFDGADDDFGWSDVPPQSDLIEVEQATGSEANFAAADDPFAVTAAMPEPSATIDPHNASTAIAVDDSDATPPMQADPFAVADFSMPPQSEPESVATQPVETATSFDMPPEPVASGPAASGPRADPFAIDDPFAMSDPATAATAATAGATTASADELATAWPAPPQTTVEAGSAEQAATVPQTASDPFADPFADSTPPEPVPAATESALAIDTTPGLNAPVYAEPVDLTPRQPVRDAAVQPVSAVGSRQHVLAPGENFWTISKEHYGTVRYFGALAYHNRRVVPDDRKMRPGVTLELPPTVVLDDILARFGGTATPAAALQRSGSETAGASASRTAAAPRPNADTAPLPGFFVRDDGTPCYRVGPNETLSAIAQETLGRSSRWRQIAAMNAATLANPDRLRPGTELVLPHDAASVRQAAAR